MKVSVTSLRNRLIIAVTIGLMGFNLVTGYAVFLKARSEANELFDYELKTVARSVPLKPVNTAMATDGLQTTAPAQLTHAQSNMQSIAAGELSDDKLVIQSWYPGIAAHSSDPYYAALSVNPDAMARYPDGLRTVALDGQEWRVFTVSRSGQQIQISQPLTVRNELALKLALRILLPMWLLFPVLLLLIVWAINHGIRPLRDLSHSLANRSPSLLASLPIQPLPAELVPLVAALNHLLGQLEQARQVQRNFVADAAHELRTPLTALKLHIDNAIADKSLDGNPEVLLQLRERLDRMTRVTIQLLTLAREEAYHRPVTTQVDLKKNIQSVVGDMSMLAERKNIDLGFDIETASGEPQRRDLFLILAQPDSLKTLLTNLIDNAIRHTPTGGRIDVRLVYDSTGKLTLVVQDTGPGVKEDDINRMTQRFFRAEDHYETGSGLGLAIVVQIVQSHNLSLDIKNRTDSSGLSVSVSGFTFFTTTAANREATI